MMLRIARAFIARRLVEQQIRMLAIRPRHTVDAEAERRVVGCKVRIRVRACDAANRDASVRNQRAALTA